MPYTFTVINTKEIKLGKIGFGLPDCRRDEYIDV